MGRSKYSKVKRNYRHDPEIADLIKRVALLARVPEAAVVDWCVKAQAHKYARKKLLEKALLKDKTTAQSLATLLRK